MPLARSLDRLLELLGEPAPPALYVGALARTRGVARLRANNNTFALAEGIVPRLWLSNRVTVQTHYDLSYNLACVVGGRRRFTLFPPEQIANLYVGPLEFTLAGQPISMVRLDAPDHARFPRFRDALAHGAGRRDGAGRCTVHPVHVVASRRSTRRVQPAGELLVGRHTAMERLAIRSVVPCDHVRAFLAASEARRLAEGLRASRVRNRWRSGGASSLR